MLENKKEPKGEINLIGIQACYDRKRAQELAWMHQEKSTKPSIIQVEFTRPTGYFKLNKPAYTPYSSTEQEILLQDGLKVEVHSVGSEKVKVKNQNKDQKKICYKA